MDSSRQVLIPNRPQELAMKLMCFRPRNSIRSNGDSNDSRQFPRRLNRRQGVRLRLSCQRPEDELFETGPSRITIMPPLSQSELDGYSSCATTASMMTGVTKANPGTGTAISRLRCNAGNNGTNDCFSAEKKTTGTSSSIYTLAESSISSSSSNEKEPNDDDKNDTNLDESLQELSAASPPCLKVLTQEESLLRRHSCGWDRSSSSGKRALAMLTAMATPSSSSASALASLSRRAFSPPKRVEFSTVTVHFHPLILGDHPSVSEGPPLMIDWESFASVAYETIEDFQENKEPREEDDDVKQRRQRLEPQEQDPQVPISKMPAASKNYRRKWPAHQRRSYLKGQLGTTGTEILRVEFEVRRIQLSRKTEAHIFTMEQLLATPKLNNGDEEEKIECSQISYNNQQGVVYIDESALRGSNNSPPPSSWDEKQDNGILEEIEDDGILDKIVPVLNGNVALAPTTTAKAGFASIQTAMRRAGGGQCWSSPPSEEEEEAAEAVDKKKEDWQLLSSKIQQHATHQQEV